MAVDRGHGMRGSRARDEVFLTPEVLHAHALEIGAVRPSRFARAAPRALVVQGASVQGPISFHQGELRQATFQDSRFPSMNLRGADLRRTTFENCTLREAIFEDAKLEGASFEGSDLTGVRFQGANLRGANLRGVLIERGQLQGADLRGADLTGAVIIDSDLDGADLGIAVLDSAYLRRVSMMQNLVLQGAKLDNATLIGCQAEDMEMGGGLQSAAGALVVGCDEPFRWGEVRQRRGVSARLSHQLRNAVERVGGRAIALPTQEFQVIDASLASSAGRTALDPDLVPELVRLRELREQMPSLVDALQAASSHDAQLHGLQQGGAEVHELLVGAPVTSARDVAQLDALLRRAAKTMPAHVSEAVQALRNARELSSSEAQRRSALDAFAECGNRAVQHFVTEYLPGLEELEARAAIPEGQRRTPALRALVEELSLAFAPQLERVQLGGKVQAMLTAHEQCGEGIVRDLTEFERGRTRSSRPFKELSVDQLRGPLEVAGRRLEDADLAGLRLPPRSSLRAANLRGANLERLSGAGLDLRAADLSAARASGLQAPEANLADAQLVGAVLIDADLPGADLKGAVLRGARLQGVDLRGADLRGADLCDADLRGADLRGAKLAGAKLDGCTTDGAKWEGATFEEAPTVPLPHDMSAARRTGPAAAAAGRRPGPVPQRRAVRDGMFSPPSPGQRTSPQPPSPGVARRPPQQPPTSSGWGLR